MPSCCSWPHTYMKRISSTVKDSDTNLMSRVQCVCYFSVTQNVAGDVMMPLVGGGFATVVCC